MSGLPLKPTIEHGSPPRFGLRSLFAVVAILCGTFALMAQLGPVGSSALLLFGILVAAHVIGNRLGTHLCDRSTAEHSPATADARFQASWPIATATRLQQRHSGGPAAIVCASGGAVLGACLGIALLTMMYGQQMSIAAIVLGGIASAVLGALSAFLMSCMLHNLHRSWRDAVNAEMKSIDHRA